MAIQIPLVVILYEKQSLTGRKRIVVENSSDLSLTLFSDQTSSIIVRPGPDYNAWKIAHPGKEPTVGFYEQINYGGAALILTEGVYPNIHNLYNFGDIISSVSFNPPLVPASPAAPVRLMVELFRDPGYFGNQLLLTENCPDISSIFGIEFNDTVTSVRVIPGPNYAQGNTVRLFNRINFDPAGGWIDLPPGNYPNIGASNGFNDVVSSVKIQ